jgi:hypothetical protein
VRLMLIPCIGLLANAATAQAQEARVKHSDVVFMGAKDAELYDAYQATMVSWGGQVWQDTDAARKHFVKGVDAAHQRGMRYCAGLAFRTAFAKMIDFDEGFEDSICRRLDGEKLLVPWLWDHEHKGHPAYWFCTNAPGYREFLRWQVRMATVTDIEGLHIDDYAGTAGTEWRGGCFCRHCMAGFREYLKANVPEERLRECGVESLDGFDYGEFLRGQGVTVDDYRRKVGSSLPLGPEYLTFQYTTAAEWVEQIHKYAEEIIGHPLMLSVNSAANSPKALVIADKLTYFCGEVGRNAEARQVPTNPIFVFKLGDALGKPQVSTASGQDWAYCMEHNLPGLVRTWVAQAYAYGHQLMAPVRQWAYTQEKGTHWYETDPDDFVDLYRFVRENADLFDDYEAIAHVGLVYSNAAFRKNQQQAREACIALARLNVPLRLLIAGDDWLADRLTADDLEGLKAVVVAEPLELDEEQQAVLDAAKDRIVTWPDEERLFTLVPREITVEDADNITVIARSVPGDADRPLVLHLVNRNHDGEADRPEPQANLRLKLAPSLSDRAPIAKATLYAPQHEPVELQLTRAHDGVQIVVPELELWGVVRLQRAAD